MQSNVQASRLPTIDLRHNQLMLWTRHQRLQASCLTWRHLEQYTTGWSCTYATGNRKLGQPSQPAPDAQTSFETKRQTKVKVERDQRRNLTLLDELFPEEAKQRNIVSRKSEPIPRLSLDLPTTPTATLQPTPPRPTARLRGLSHLPLDQRRDAERLHDRLKEQDRQNATTGTTSALILRRASKSLAEEDFRRITPQAKQLEGWSLQNGEILKVIPGRDPNTLERKPFYFILFTSSVSAFAYQTHVTRLHKLVQLHVPDSSISLIPPPSGFTVGEDDIYAILQAYALVPPSQDIKLVAAPVQNSHVRRIIEMQGYPGLVDRPGRAPVEVLLRLEGQQMSIYGISQAIARSARARGMPWTGDREEVKIVKWEPDESMVDSSQAREDTEEGLGDEQEDDKTPAEERKGRHRVLRKAAPSYILGFQTHAEADRFVRFWHRRPMETQNGKEYARDIAPVVHAEVLW